MIEVKNIVKHYKTTQAVNDISFTVNKGEIFGFLGPNGAGKSTLIKMLIGNLAPTSGSIKIHGFDPQKEAKQLHKHIGIVPEIQNLYERMTAKENLEFFAKLYGTSKKQIDPLLERLELKDRSKDKLKNFSFGMKQRILIARALLAEPDILFMDEPTKGLDPHSSRRIRTLIKEENAKGRTIFLTTHYMEEAEYLSDRVAIINQGELVAMDTPQKLKQKQTSLLVLTKNSPNNAYQEISLEDTKSKQNFIEMIQDNSILSVKSNEETLEDVFIRLTGRDLI